MIELLTVPQNYYRHRAIAVVVVVAVFFFGVRSLFSLLNFKFTFHSLLPLHSFTKFHRKRTGSTRARFASGYTVCSCLSSLFSDFQIRQCIHHTQNYSHTKLYTISIQYIILSCNNSMLKVSFTSFRSVFRSLSFSFCFSNFSILRKRKVLVYIIWTKVRNKQKFRKEEAEGKNL